MRLWSLHPKYLDRQGLLAVWREGLLAKKVLQGKTTGYKRHPQLIRFKRHPSPLVAIDYFLLKIYDESVKRSYRFDKTKIDIVPQKIERIKVRKNEIDFEQDHLRRKLAKRSKVFLKQMEKIKRPVLHPLFKLVENEIEPRKK